MDDPFINLSFPMLEYGRHETPWDLRPLLYRGGAAANVKHVAQLISSNQLGGQLVERLELVSRLHEEVSSDLAGGGSRFSALNKIGALRRFFAWADSVNLPITIKTVPELFVRWTDYMVQSNRNAAKFSSSMVYDSATLTATLLDRALDRKAGLIRSTRIRKPRGTGKVHTSQAAKQKLQDTLEFGYLLARICDTLTWNATTGPLPVSVSLTSDRVIELWSGLRDPKISAMRRTRPQKPREIEASNAKYAAWSEDGTLRTRTSLVNLRIECELLMFIAQTGLNLSQAHKLRLEQYHYTSHLDGYQVRAYKARRKGEVLFEVFASYKEWFERYLAWRARWFSVDDNSLLFPLIRSGGRLVESAPQFSNLSRICDQHKLAFVRPKKLRGSRINWLLRQTRNPELVAELSQHSVETLLRVYVDPHPQTAMVEITRFHQLNDPAVSPPAPGRCVSATPKSLDQTPDNAPPPDCINAAGCLFCAQHRDIESLDHVWSLASLRHLKTIELARYSPPQSRKQAIVEHPAFITVERLTAKLRFFEESNIIRRGWAEEAEARVREGDYHPNWYGFIRLAELRQGAFL